MKEVERAFADGEIIFREGEPSRAAYLLSRGRVELVKLAEKTATRISLLRPGDMFGELGLLDESPRAATARAVGPVLVKEIPRQELLQSSVADTPQPSITLPSLGGLMDRLRGAVMPADETPASSAPPEPKRTPLSIIDRLLGAGFTSRSKPTLVMIAPLADDAGGIATRALASILNRRHGLRRHGAVPRPFGRRDRRSGRRADVGGDDHGAGCRPPRLVIAVNLQSAVCRHVFVLKPR